MNISDASQIPEPARRAFVDLLLAGADDDFLIGHSASEWTGLSPILEEDIAMSSMAQDEIAHARELYRVIGEITGRSADQLAYDRPQEDYRCAALVLQPDDFDWAVLIARQFLYEHFDSLRLEVWQQSSYTPLAQVANRVAAEELFHIHHVDAWVRRLARGGAESRDRIQAAVNSLWGQVGGLFEETEGFAVLAKAGLQPAETVKMKQQYETNIAAAMENAGLKTPPSALPSKDPAPGGRLGFHGEALGVVLDELREVYLLEPGVAW